MTTSTSGAVQNGVSAACESGFSDTPIDNGIAESHPDKEPLLRYMVLSVRELGSFRYALTTFVVNTLKRRYRRSILGFAWSLLNPLLMMGVMSLVFSVLLKSNIKDYAFYMFSGMLPWTHIVDSILGGSQSIVQSEHFLRKVYIPKLFFPLVSVSVETVNFSLALTSLILLCSICGHPFTWAIVALPAVVALSFLFSFSVALTLSVVTVYFRDLTHILQVGLTAMFYLTPVIYSLRMVPAAYQGLLFLNPFYHFITLFHKVLYYGVFPSSNDWFTALTIALCALCAGFYILKRKERDLIYRL